jgi:nickel-dependent lactate racemase
MTTTARPTRPISAPPSVRLLGGPGQLLDADQVHRFVAEALADVDLDGRRVCVIVPDGTRSCPLPLLMDAVHAALHDRASTVTALVALGTHAAMGDADLAVWFGYDGEPSTRYPGLRIVNHAWWDPDALVTIGTVTADRMAELSEGRLAQAVDVRINREVLEHDLALVVGPVFPHEVVGFSGGNKYFFPGVAGPEIIDVSHWLGALITSADIIGTRGTTPVRALIDEAAAMVPTTRLALSVVVPSGADGLHAIAFGRPEDSWAAAADVSARTHIRYLERPVRRVLSVMPPKYRDIWTAAKGFYKLEPVVADGGEVIIYAPHITEIAPMHPEIMEIGYHTRDYFVRQWDRFQHIHWGVLAHSTHLRGGGTYDPVAGEQPRVKVTLATGIPEDVVRAVNLDHLDPAAVDRAALDADPDTLVVDPAGEILYRLRRPH